MPDDLSPAAKRQHLERLVARGGDMTLDAARDLVSRVIAMHVTEFRAAFTGAVLSVGLGMLAVGFVIGLVVAVLT